LNLAYLPAVNACLNGASAVLLGAGYYFIRRKNKVAHRNCMLAAFFVSTLFLGCYLTYHGYAAYHLHRGPTVFRDPVWFRPIYLGILLTHTALAAAIVPLTLATMHCALRQRFQRHKKLARWSWPCWMYVSVTGVLIYLLLYRIFPQR